MNCRLRTKYEENFLVADLIVSVIMVLILIGLIEMTGLWHSISRDADMFCLWIMLCDALLIVINGVTFYFTVPMMHRKALQYLKEVGHDKTIDIVYVSAMRWNTITLLSAHLAILTTSFGWVGFLYLPVIFISVALSRTYRGLWIWSELKTILRMKLLPKEAIK